MREGRGTVRLSFGLPFYLRSACRAQNTPALRTHALLSRIRYAPLQGADSFPQASCGSLPQILSSRLGSGVATATPSGQACTADSGQTKRNGAKHIINKVILIGRLGQNAEAKTGQNNPEYVVLNIATQENWKNDKGDDETRTEWHHIYASRNLSKFARTLQKGQLITLEGTLRYREVEDEVVAPRSSTGSLRSMPPA
jgi:single-strand DNA-binding protein